MSSGLVRLLLLGAHYRVTFQSQYYALPGPVEDNVPAQNSVSYKFVYFFFIGNRFCGIAFLKFIFKPASFCKSKVSHLQLRADDFCSVTHVQNACFVQSL